MHLSLHVDLFGLATLLVICFCVYAMWNKDESETSSEKKPLLAKPLYHDAEDTKTSDARDLEAGY